MNSEPPYTIYPSKQAAIDAGVPEKQLVEGDEGTLKKLQSRLLEKSKHKRIKPHGRRIPRVAKLRRKP